jgi:sugar-specific transcriptional regulator TrmB
MKYSEIQETLERIGLSKNEARVYLILLKLGSQKAGGISKESQINRTTTYDALKRLLEKGLISYVVKANRKWFEPGDPKRLTQFIKEMEEDAKQVAPILQKIYKTPKEKRNVTMFYGYKGIKSVFMDIISEGKINCVMDSEGQFFERMPYFAPQYIKQLERKNIKVKHLVREGRDVKPSKTTEIRFIAKKTKSEAAINIYGNKVAIIIWTEPPEAVIIENRAVADSFRDYFEILWKQEKK